MTINGNQILGEFALNTRDASDIIQILVNLGPLNFSKIF